MCWVRHIKVINVACLENIPQLLIQIAHLLVFGTEDSDIVYYSLTSSGLSVASTLLSYWVSRKHDYNVDMVKLMFEMNTDKNTYTDDMLRIDEQKGLSLKHLSLSLLLTTLTSRGGGCILP